MTKPVTFVPLMGIHFVGVDWELKKQHEPLTFTYRGRTGFAYAVGGRIPITHDSYRAMVKQTSARFLGVLERER